MLFPVRWSGRFSVQMPGGALQQPHYIHSTCPGQQISACQAKDAGDTDPREFFLGMLDIMRYI